jgi:hypothetical protein
MIRERAGFLFEGVCVARIKGDGGRCPPYKKAEADAKRDRDTSEKSDEGAGGGE